MKAIFVVYTVYCSGDWCLRLALHTHSGAC